MSTPPNPPDEDSDEDATMLKNLANATDKYEAAIAIQPEAARPLNTYANKQPDHHNNNKNRNHNTSAIQAGVEIGTKTKTTTRATTSKKEISTT